LALPPLSVVHCRNIVIASQYPQDKSFARSDVVIVSELARAGQALPSTLHTSSALEQRIAGCARRINNPHRDSPLVTYRLPARQVEVTTEHSLTLDGLVSKKRKRPEGDAESFGHNHDHACVYKAEMEDAAQVLRDKNSDYRILERTLMDKDAKIRTLTHESTWHKGAYSVVFKQYGEVKQEFDTLYDAFDD
jgi:hypothetical protein